MRLAVVSPFVDRCHGTEKALAELLERLARDKHFEIHLYSQRVEGVTLANSSQDKPPNSGRVIWHKVPRLPGPQLLQFLSWLILNSFYRAWDRAIHGFRPDLIFSPGINCLDADVVIVHALFHRLLELARDEQLPVLRVSPLRRVHRRIYYTLLTRLERRIYANPKVALAAVSQRTATLLNEYFRRQDVVIIPNGVDSALFSPSARIARRGEARLRRKFKEHDFVILLIGNDWRVKGLRTVLAAVAALNSLPLHVLAAGEDAPGPFLDYAKQLGIPERCHFEPPRKDVLDLYAAADLYVSPSLEDSFGMPVTEAMACGLPVITSRLAGASELFQEGVEGLMIKDPGNSGELAKMLDNVFHNTAPRLRIGEAAALKAREWTWDRNVNTVFQWLEKMTLHDVSA